MIGVKHDYTPWEYFFLWKAGILLFESATYVEENR